MRRIEGTLLHPSRSARGTYLFTTHEVEALKRSLDAGAVHLWRSFGVGSERDQPWPATRVMDGRYRRAREDLLDAQEALSVERRRHQREIEELKASHTAEVAEYENALSVFERQLEDLTE